MNLKDSPQESIKGVLFQSRGPWLTFKSCSLLTKGEAPAPIDGEVVLHRSAVTFLQVLQ